MSKDKVEITSLTWKVVSGKANDVLIKAKTENDRRGIDQRDADFERGRIAAMREILKLGDPAPTITAEQPAYGT